MTDNAKSGTAAMLPLLLSGCQSYPHSPMIPVFGAFVPSWILCAVLGIFSAILLRQLFVLVGLDEFLPLRLLVYVASSVLAGIGFWFLLFAGLPQ